MIRPEGAETGNAKLVGTDEEATIDEVSMQLTVAGAIGRDVLANQGLLI